MIGVIELKKKSIIIIVIITLINIFISLNSILFKEKSNIVEENINTINKDDRMLSMMLETEAGSGNYEMTTRSEWPTDGYKFNSELSKCENGGELLWDETNKTVLMTGNTSDKCYVYFNMIDPNLPIPTNPTMTFDNKYNIILSGSTSQNGEVDYYYSFDNISFTKGSTISVDSSKTIYAYAMDNKKQKSDVVSKKVTISNPETGDISSKYYCSKDGTYQDSSSCSYIYNASKKDSGTGGISRNDYYCPNGGSLYGATRCLVSYTGTAKYTCSKTTISYNSYEAALNDCTSCSSGTKYNGKCYNLS